MTYTIYSKHGCPFCEQIKLLFELNEFRFVEYRLGRDFTGSEFYDQFGVGSTFPQILMGEKGTWWMYRNYQVSSRTRHLL